jgi:hypothetical protein
LSNCRTVRRETENQEWILNVHRWMNIQQSGEVAYADVESSKAKCGHLFCVQHKRRRNADFVEPHDFEYDLDYLLALIRCRVIVISVFEFV